MRTAGATPRARCTSSARSPRSATAWRAPGRKCRRSPSPPSRATPSAAGSRWWRRSTGASSPTTRSCRCPKSRSAFRSPGARCRGWSISWALRAPSASPSSANAFPPQKRWRWGSRDWIAPPGKAVKTAGDIARQVLALPRNSVRMTKDPSTRTPASARMRQATWRTTRCNWPRRAPRRRRRAKPSRAGARRARAGSRNCAWISYLAFTSASTQSSSNLERASLRSQA